MLGGIKFSCQLYVYIMGTTYKNFLDIQVQHTHMTDTAAADHATVELIVNTLHWFFPSFDYRWCYGWLMPTNYSSSLLFLNKMVRLWRFGILTMYNK